MLLRKYDTVESVGQGIDVYCGSYEQVVRHERVLNGSTLTQATTSSIKLIQLVAVVSLLGQ